jgi:argininosuccinate lyase
MRSGRFEKKLTDAMRTLNASIGFDKRLYREDIGGSIAWAEALRAQGVISADEEAKVQQALRVVRKEMDDGTFEFSDELEDIHMNVEARVCALAGSAGQKLHTGRSRNDQVATDFRLYVKRVCGEIQEEIAGVVSSIVTVAEREIDVVIPAYTHLQRAQPVLLAHHLLAYAEMFLRDRRRFAWAALEADSCPLGSGACAGNQFGIDREQVQARLGFAELTRNSMDAVSDRDFALTFLHAANLLLVHLSRLSEDLILWSSAEFGFVVLDDSVTTGSSMLPQKKNADACELARGKCGRVLGNYVGLATTLKGLPLTYNKDLQEDKEPVFDAAETIGLLLPVFRSMLETLQVNKQRTRAALRDGFLEALSVADYLTRKGVPFREAHGVAGQAVRRAEELAVTLPELSLQEYQNLHATFEKDLFEAISIAGALADKDVVGGTAPARVRAELEGFSSRLEEVTIRLGEREDGDDFEH